jgi:ABC-type phosphate transport system substrate-binding protein
MKWIAMGLAAAALAGCGSSDDLSIIAYGRENSSGTHTYFREHVLGGADFAPSVESMPGTAALVGAVLQDPRALGYGGIAYLKGVRPLRVKKVDGGPAYGPTAENAQKGLYPLTRNLYYYTVGAPEGAARSFVDWVRSADGQKICTEVGYFPIPDTARASAAGDPPAGKQTLSIKGSDTLKLLSSSWGEQFMKLHPDVRVEVLGGGSEIGIKALLDGETQICQASRPLKPAEIDEIKAKRGKSPEEFVVAVDGLAVFVNEKNPVEEISMSQLKAIYLGKVTRWGELKAPTP